MKRRTFLAAMAATAATGPIIKSGPAFEPESIYKVAFVRKKKPLQVVNATLDHGIDFVVYHGEVPVTKSAMYTAARFLKDGKVFYIHKFPSELPAEREDAVRVHLTQKLQ